MASPFAMRPSASKEDYEKKLIAASTKIYSDFQLLHGVLKRHQATIQRRWRRKNTNKKKQILLAAWGKRMVDLRRPDLEAFYSLPRNKKHPGPEHHDAFMWPSINTEKLTSQSGLLSLLTARGSFHPYEFVDQDRAATNLGILTEAVSLERTPDCVYLFKQKDQPEHYCRVLEPKTLNEISGGRIHGEGHLVLEFQEKMMAFLVSCVRHILHDIDIDAPNELHLEIEPLTAPDQSTEDTSDALVENEDCLRPEKYDLGRIKQLASAQKEAANDHIWSLRDDPSYFVYEVGVAREHRIENVKDNSGKVDAIVHDDPEGLLHARVIIKEVVLAYFFLDTWVEDEVLLKEVQERQTICTRGPGRCSNMEATEFAFAKLKLRLFLESTAILLSNMLWQFFLCSNPMRKYSVYVPGLDDDRHHVKMKTGANLNKSEQKLVWLMETLSDHEHVITKTQPHMLLNEIKRMIFSKDSAGALITPHIATLIQTFAVLAECMRQLDTYKPIDNRANLDLEALRLKVSSHVRRYGTHQDALQKHEETIAKLGSTSGGRFFCPGGKRTTVRGGHITEEAEKNLNALWEKLDSIADASSFGGFSKIETRERVREIYNPQKQPNQAQVSKPEEPCLTPAQIDRLREYLTEQTLQDNYSPTPKSEKKLKTKGAANPQPGPENADPNNANEDAPAEDAIPKIMVDKRALEAFAVIFPVLNQRDHPGQLSWRDFLHAMKSVGFSAEHLYGSIWSFKPMENSTEHGINFHSPHPESKMSYWRARQNGHRLTKTYGWHYEVFQLAEK